MQKHIFYEKKFYFIQSCYCFVTCNTISNILHFTTLNTAGDLSNYFTRRKYGNINKSASPTNTGISGSGAVFIGNASANEFTQQNKGIPMVE